MKRMITAAMAAVCLLLSGCSTWMDGSYVSVKPHVEQQPQISSDMRTISNCDELLAAIATMVKYGKSNEVFIISDYDSLLLSSDVSEVERIIKIQNPIGAYAVDSIESDIGVNAGLTSLAVKINYRHTKAEILRIKNVAGMEEAKKAVYSAMNQLKSGLVLQIEHYQDTDFEQVAADYALKYPEKVIEVPEVTALVYPDFGETRVVELKFSYQTSRDALRNMQNMVSGVFASADLYVSGDSNDVDRYYHLYGFLDGRYNYVFETSITPSYSLLCHGVGDSKAFAAVYSAMCRQAGLTCQVVTGTRDGKPWYWNIIRMRDTFYHVDLMESIRKGKMEVHSDREMSGYVWDYSAYPKCGDPQYGADYPGYWSQMEQ